MNFEDVIPTISAKDHRAQRRGERTGGSRQREKALRTIDQPGQHERELNPYWKEGGIGLPKEDEAKPAEPTLATSAVGDGGLKWLKRAYQRIREQAADEGRSVEEIAAERYGSLEKLESMIAEAESRASSSGERHHRRHDLSRRYGRMQKPGSDDEKERQSRYKAMQRPGSDEEMERPSRYHTKHRDSLPSGSKKRSEERGRFQRPGDDDDANQDSHAGKHQHRREHSSSSSKPSWMRKEFYKEPKDRQDAQKPDDRNKGGNSLQEKQPASRQQEKSSSSKQLKQENEPGSNTQREERVAPKLLSDKELNALGAKLIKAEMLGNTALYDKLKKEIEEARKARESAGASTCPDGAQRGSREEVVILTKTDNRGFAHPLSEPSEVGGPSRKKAKVPTHDRGGERVRYFADDDRHSLKNLFEREKMTTAEDQNAEFARLAGKVRISKNEEYDFDDAAMDKASQHDSSAKQDARDRMQAIQEHKHMSKALEKCKYCLDSHEMKKHLIIAIGIRIPRGLPYFSVDFGLQGGFAHVVEDEKEFPVYFGKEVVGGMLDSEPRLWLKQRHESFDEQKKKVLEFSKWWEPYDWTERLKTESS
ncbi:hypothetical protein HPB49_015475 [Dermacentor silvarum]|uniref:Uncharacterized protein n=1 Tax=Dermacentor silvarum TaxID=543639 RepID=A0ACB8CYB5_DERSI|nr:hypothetical protein HPB49_015475 [Dermacentor silvarum]